jgi:serine protease inhibitor
MVVDRPFLCAIVDKPTGAVLFAGTVSNPKKLG